MHKLRYAERLFDTLDSACRDEWTYRGRTRLYQALWAERTRLRTILLAFD